MVLQYFMMHGTGVPLEDPRMAELRTRPIANSPFGVEIAGLDPVEIGDIDPAVIKDVAKHAHGLLCFTFERLLSEAELHALTALFGASEYGPGIINGLGKAPLPGEEVLNVAEQVEAVIASGEDPYLVRFGNVDPETAEHEPTYPEFFGRWSWYTDMSYVEVPPTYSLLHARVVPEQGGDTGFCDQVAAAAELPASLRAKVLSLRVKHDATFGSDGSLRPGMTPPDSPIEAEGYPHPIIRVLPETGEHALFLGRRLNGYVMDMSLHKSEQLLDELWTHATQPQFCYRHKWRTGQVVAWDNRRLLHMRHPLEKTEGRFMWRTQTKGEAVQAASS